jgi:hypothetical protein
MEKTLQINEQQGGPFTNKHIQVVIKLIGAIATGKLVIRELVSYEPAPELFCYLIGKCLCQFLS